MNNKGPIMMHLHRDGSFIISYTFYQLKSCGRSGIWPK